ncbi:hypothetical protein A9404_01150 [Halothiobacillus diazotrophicus]|uniref:Uncharacterized protein n=1 Tax=Halothiobacillus diazotrophicus TaxID=1860122 RepID=A0A191ZE69_9GAMM|nr:hypothetical protein [Halothiobacillus diazotrophicus]ANJ66164.1 hypothetical protein A9404_01150 [Halothiobacillus diazotrophicus]
MNSSRRSIWVGFRQRLATSLIQDFYPEGMPDDWRNNYLVMMTSAVWIADTDADAADALAAVADAPKPVLAVLERGAGAAQSPFTDWLVDHADLPVIRLAPDEALWRPDAAASGCRVGLIPAQDQPKLLRTWIESFIAQAPEVPCALFVDGDQPSVPTMERLQTLVELMGL